jgi:kumamolisin
MRNTTTIFTTAALALLTTACPADDTVGNDEVGTTGSESGTTGSTDDEVGVTEESGTSMGSTDEATTESTSESTTESTSESSSSETSSTSTTDTTSDSGTETGGGGLLDDIPPEEWEPIPNPDGVPAPLPGVYDDQGVADPNASFRSLIGLDMIDRAGLVDFVDEVSDPSSAIFGQYMTLDEFMANHAPSAYDFQLLQEWLAFEGFSVNYLATNRMLIQFSGTVQQFNDAFDTTLHVCMRKNPQQGNPPIPVYCTPEPMTLPIFVADRSPGIVTCDEPAEVGQLPNEGGQIMNSPPAGATTGSRLTPARVAQAYDVDDLYAMGYDGTGEKLGVIMGATIHFKWAQTFWQSFGIVRTNPEIHYLMEDPVTRYVEAQLDNEWSGAVAKGADMVGYSGPDSRNTSMVFVFNEALALAVADGVGVLTDSFAHREDSEPQVVRNQYNDSALFGAAQGLTILAASGDSAGTDTPSSSQYVTAVGGTRLTWSGNVVTNETAWSASGSGITISFAMPFWQEAVAGNIANNRVVVDLAAAADPASPYWIFYNSQWLLYGGTSFSSPVWAGILTIINQYRVENGMPRVGYLNPQLYLDPAVQATFRDITAGATPDFAAGVGWDVPTGWGSPRALALAQALP